MIRRMIPPLLLSLIFAACSDQTAPAPPPDAVSLRASTPAAAREQLAQALAVALADPATRASIAAQLAASPFAEGKLQFQTLMRANQQALLASLARAAARTPADLLADMDAARGLELYLPVPTQRATWRGSADFVVATAGDDEDPPVGFLPNGNRVALDPRTPPSTPVIALMPQEAVFSPSRGARMMSCGDNCGGDDVNGDGGFGGYGGYGGNPGNGNGSVGAASNSEPGLSLVQSHFNESHESWLKSDPEFEYHVYGVGDNGESVQLACTGEHAGGAYAWDQNSLDWSGSAMLLSDADYNAYQAKHPGAPIRIVAWEDDDEPCVDHANVTTVSQLITAVDKAYSAITSGKVNKWYVRGIEAAPSIFSLVSAIHNVILTNDDLIGNAVEGSVTGDAPAGANWVLKSAGQITTGWFTTERRN
jgi:hypothetical protein